MPLDRFLMGLGIRQVGQHIARVLARHFGSLDRLMTANQAQFQQIHEIGPEISTSLESFFLEERNRQVIERLVLLGMEIEPPLEPAGARREADLPLAGKTFVFTGGLEGYTREEARRLVESRGGEVVSSVSKKTAYVVVGADPGSKLQQAQKLGVTVLNEAGFTDLMTPA